MLLYVFPYFLPFSYDLDPNDGYSSRVPGNNYRLPIINTNKSPGKHHNHYVPNYNSIQLVSSTAAPQKLYPTTDAPRVQISTQQSPHYQYETIPLAGYQSTAEPPYRVPSTTPATRQHLTETTQIQPPTVSTYHPNHHHNHHNEHYDVYKVKKLNSPPKPYKTTVLNPVPVAVVNQPIEPQYIVHPQQASHPADYGINSSSISLILKKLQDSNHLPQTITPDNIDNSIRTLVKILNNLKNSQKVADVPSQHHHETDDYDDGSSTNGGESTTVLNQNFWCFSIWLFLYERIMDLIVVNFQRFKMDHRDPIRDDQALTILHCPKFHRRALAVKSNDTRVSSAIPIRIVRCGIIAIWTAVRPLSFAQMEQFSVRSVKSCLKSIEINENLIFLLWINHIRCPWLAIGGSMLNAHRLPSYMF